MAFTEIRLRRVEADGEGPVAERNRDPGRAILEQIGNGDASAFTREAQRDCGADPAAAAGHDRHLTFETRHSDPLRQNAETVTV
ncbi:MAG: hypothetical protein WDN69_17005 [Aliidongia sp.]